VGSGKPLARRIVVPRPEAQAEKTAEAVRARGWEAVVVPIAEIGPPPDQDRFDRALGELGSYDVVAFTSANGVAAVFGRTTPDFGRARVAAIGPATAKALEERGVRAEIVAEEHRGEGLAEAVVAAVGRSSRVLVLRALVARDAFPDALRSAGLSVDVVAAYQKHPAPEGPLVVLGEALEAGRIDAVLLMSSSAVETLAARPGPALLARAVMASIGPVTTETATRLGVRVDVTASPYTLEGLLTALSRWFSRDVSRT
jgi:uroporphyrinogen III methyltransferase / synthase